MANPVPAAAEQLLTSQPLMAHFATCTESRPHVAPVWYHYDEGTVEVLTTGQKLANVRENPRVAISVQKDEEGQAQWMVTLRGTATVVEDEEECRQAAARINPKYGAEPDEYSENVLVRVEVGSASYQTY